MSLKGNLMRCSKLTEKISGKITQQKFESVALQKTAELPTKNGPQTKLFFPINDNDKRLDFYPFEETEETDEFEREFNAMLKAQNLTGKIRVKLFNKSLSLLQRNCPPMIFPNQGSSPFLFFLSTILISDCLGLMSDWRSSQQ